MRRLAVLVVLCLAAAACADDDDSASSRGSTATSASGASGATTGGATTGGPSAPSTTAPSTSAAGTGPTASGAPTVPGATETSTPAATVPPAPVGQVPLALQQVAELDSPVALAFDPRSDAVFVAEQGGALRVVRGGQVQPDPVVDLRGQVSTGNEQGLLGVAISPDGAFAYLDHTDRSGDIHITEYALDDQRAVTGNPREVLEIDHHQFSNHNGGQLVFGPDGDLYIAVGDGGSEGDPQGNGQKLSTLLAKILRISPRPAGDQPYGIPPDNPFVGRADARPEIWAWGVRNPWRFSFDRQTGEMWIGDVGGSIAEEIDWAPPGAGGRNYGWVAAEGSHIGPSTPAEAIAPVVDVEHSEGVCSIMGGFVYRGAAIPGLVGTYLYGDFCRPAIYGLRANGGQITEGPATVGLDVRQLTSFGQDDDGELWVTSRAGALSKVVAG